MKTLTTSKKRFHLKLLAVSISLVLPSMTSQASDLEIYQAAKEGGGTVMLMLDTSGSMKQWDNGNCRKDTKKYTGDATQATDTLIYSDRFAVTVKTDDKGAQGKFEDGEVVGFQGRGCELSTDTEKLDRLTVLKDTLIPFLADPSKSLGGDYLKFSIGLGSFFNRGYPAVGGQVNYPATALDYEGRLALIKKISNLSADGGTPSAHAYAEAGAYLLGTTTDNGVKLGNLLRGYIERIAVYNQTRNAWEYEFTYYVCDQQSTTYKKENDYWNKEQTFRGCNSFTQEDQIVLNRGYGLTRNDLLNFDLSRMGDFDFKTHFRGDRRTLKLYYFNEEEDPNGQPDSKAGINLINADSAPDILEGNNYKSPISDNSQCKGYGIYFLTDGVPNSTTDTSVTRLMNTSLAGTTSVGTNGQCSVSDTGNAFVDAQASNTGSGWACMAEYSKKLFSADNPKNTSIATATVGFGSTFEELAGLDLITKPLLNPDGSPKLDDAGKAIIEEVYDCYSASRADTRNLCLLGEKGYGYGEGGFTYAETADELGASLVEFLLATKEQYDDNIATGFMSIPLDQLNTQKSRGVAYLPTLEPVPGSLDLWKGNLKKFNVQKGTLVGAAKKKNVFKDESGSFSEETHDVWNTVVDTTREDAERPDKGKPQVGGAYQQIFENDDLSRNVYVNIEGKLVKLEVTGSNGSYVTSGFDEFTKSTDADSLINIKKRQLLKFMGYKFSPDLIPEDNTPITAEFSKSNKTLGGVIHSKPQLITTEIKLKDGKFDNSTRKDYVLYGSMDGALHLLDDKTGKEILNFIPNHLLDLQPFAIDGGSTQGIGVPHGVDAPWNIYTSYDLNLDADNSRFESKQLFATGGLRMGGSRYYGLDLSDFDKPNLLYSIGSTYVNKLADSSQELLGFKNGITVTGSEGKAFSRFGQSWGKPATGLVKVGDKKVMVNFLPGGYDIGYESTQYKPTTTAPAQGNSVYMVKIGEEKEVNDTDGNVVGTEVTAKDSGDLLWWASSGGTDVTSASASLKYNGHSDMIHSVVTEVTAFDRNYDGLTDHIYFADLGGQVWRADINNNKDTTDFTVDRVVKVLDVSARAGDKEQAPRFYERPLITFDRIDYGQAQASKIVAQVTIGSGNRSLPVTAQREAATSDAIFSFIDKDMSKQNLFCYTDCDGVTGPDLDTEELTVDSLEALTLEDTDTIIETNMVNTSKEGWYFPLNSWVNTDASGKQTILKNQKGIKSLNQPDAIASVLFVSRYNPNEGNTINECEAGIIGSTQVEQLCLPYGTCGSTERNIMSTGLGIVDSILTQTNPQSDDDPQLGILDTFCEGEECERKVLCPEGQDCSELGPDAVSVDEFEFGTINNSQVLNPLQWMERD